MRTASNPVPGAALIALLLTANLTGCAPDSEVESPPPVASQAAPSRELSSARAALAAGDLEGARAAAEAALDGNPAAARVVLSQIALAAGDLALAEREAVAALEAQSPNTAATMSLARIRMIQGRSQEALELTERAAAETDGPLPGLTLLRATLLVRLGRLEEAEAELRAEIERQPAALRVHSRLALLLARHGRPREAVEAVRGLVESNPTPAGFAAAARTLADLGDPESARALADAGLERFPGDPRLEEVVAEIEI